MITNNLGNLEESSVTLSGLEALNIVELVYRYVPIGVFKETAYTENTLAASAISVMEAFCRESFSEEERIVLDMSEDDKNAPLHNIG